ncbi:MAG TPA: acylphosphatase [Pirellulaceae bacterium]|jgi:acylphosphatase|nr:acylphosphatase [Pirellulaceae bacterium]
MKVRSDVHYSGRVQGVGFRFNAQWIARGFVVTGFVRNLPDGRVQLVAEGEEKEVDRYLAKIADSMAGNISRTDARRLEASGEFSSFEIAR